MTKFQEVMSTNPPSISPDEVLELLKSVPARDFRFWSTLKDRYDQRKIPAIREVRDKYRLSLRVAKEIVDAIYAGIRAQPCGPSASSELFDLIEDIEVKLQRAVREAETCGHDKASSMFLRFKQEIHELWMEQFEISSER